jgi:hypothetical protein
MGIFGNQQAGQARYSGELHNLQLTQAVFGTTAPIIIGTRRVAPKLIFYGGFYATKAPGPGKGIGGGKGSQQYDYYADMLGALASGSAGGGCVGILNVWDQQGKLQNQSGTFAYTIPSGGGSITPVSGAAAPIQQDLGVSKSVAYSVVATDYGSGGSQTLTGTQSVALQKVTGTPGAGQYSFNASTGSYGFSAADAGAQVTISYSSVYSLYYFETTQAAEVPLSSPYKVSTNNQQYFYSDGGVVRVDTGATLVRGTDYTESGGVYTFSAALAGVYVYITYTFTSSDSSITNTSTLNITFFGGTLGQSPWSYMQSKYPGSAFGYTGLCYFGANPMALGMAATMPAYNYEVMGLCIFPGGGLDAHFCDGFRLLLSDAFLGVGFPSANIDAWTSCYAYWAANGYLGSIALDTQTSVADAFSKVIETGNVAPVWSAGLLKLIPYGDATCVGNGYTYTPPSPVVTLNWNDLLPPTEEEAGQTGSEDVIQWSRRAPQDSWNYVQAQWCNRQNDYNNELINEQNDAFIHDYGPRIESPQNWDWITTEAAAAWALGIRLKRQCYLPNTGKIWLPFRFSYLEPMDLVVLPTGETIRITQVDDDPEGRMAIEMEQWTYGSSSVTTYPKQQPSSFQPGFSTALPGDALPIVVQNTQAQSAVPYLVQIAATGQNSNWGGADVDISLDGENWTQIGTVTAPSAIGLLTAALPATPDPDMTDTLSVDLSLSQGSEELTSVSQLLADKFSTLCAIVDQGGESSELISYETAALASAARYNLTYLRRGVYSTAPLAHSVGAYFAYLGPQYQFATYQYNAALMGHIFFVRMRSFNLAGKQLQDPSQVQVHPFMFGFNLGQKGDIYFPSNSNPSATGTGTYTTPDNAFNGEFTSAAIFDAGPVTGVSNAFGDYQGFPAITLSYPSTLYVSYRNLAGVMQLPSGSINPEGGQASVIVSLNGVPVGNSWQIIQTAVPAFPGYAVSPAQGTVTVAIPAGTNLSQLLVQVGAQNNVATFPAPSGMVAGHIEVLQIWIQ